MWRNPDYPAPEPQQPPADDTRPLLILDRTRQGRRRELRIGLGRFNGFPFLSLKLWDDGWPAKGPPVTIRPAEIDQVIAALERAKAMLAAGSAPAPAAPAPGREAPPAYVERGRRRPEPMDVSALPRPGPALPGFDDGAR